MKAAWLAAILVFPGLLAACRSSSKDGGACSLEGAWWADLSLYDGSAHFKATAPGEYQVELIGKGSQTGTARWTPAESRLDLTLPTAPYRCNVASDCKSISCFRVSDRQPLELERR